MPRTTGANALYRVQEQNDDLVKPISGTAKRASAIWVGEPVPDDLALVIYSGRSGVQYDGKEVAEIDDGQFIGGMSFVTDEKDSADVYALEPMCCVSWPNTKLRQFQRNRPELRSAFQSVLGIKLTKLLKESWDHQPTVLDG